MQAFPMNYLSDVASEGVAMATTHKKRNKIAHSYVKILSLSVQAMLRLFISFY